MRYEDLPTKLKAQVDAALAQARGDGRNDVGATEESTRGAGKPGRQPRDASDGGKRGRCPNKTEAAYRREVLDTRRDTAAVTYEGLTFRMANGHRYTPDWLVVTKAGAIECHEVKGRRALHSQQRARLAFDQARVEFPWAAWVWAVRTASGWEVGR